jgi:hypothetical protein
MEALIAKFRDAQDSIGGTGISPTARPESLSHHHYYRHSLKL